MIEEEELSTQAEEEAHGDVCELENLARSDPATQYFILSRCLPGRRTRSHESSKAAATQTCLEARRSATFTIPNFWKQQERRFVSMVERRQWTNVLCALRPSDLR